MARSVTELLPRPFADITLDDLAAIIAAVGDERETLWFERKSALSPNALAKACAAFANTFGGLLVAGVADDDDTLTGIDPVAAEAQLWVKDTLRGLVLPMPPFRARWLPTSGEKGMLLVLVEESSSTPHLLTRSGAIYVRNPGSSDPVPISDQRQLLELTARGEAASASAVALSNDLLNAYLHESRTRRNETLAVAASGAAADFEGNIFVPEMPDRISRAVWGATVAGNQREDRTEHWSQHRVSVKRFLVRDWAFRTGNLIGAAIVDRAAGVAIYSGHTVPPEEDEGRGYDSVIESEIRQRFEQWLSASRELLLDHGAHGDLRIAYQLTLDGRNVQFNSRPDEPWARDISAPIIVELWTDFAEDVTDRVFDEVARAAGIGPRLLDVQ